MSGIITLLGNHRLQKDQQTYIKHYSKLTRISQRRKGRGSKGKMLQERSTGGSPGALLLHWTVKAELDVQHVSKMPTLLIPAVFPSFLSHLAIDLIFQYCLLWGEPNCISCSITPAWEPYLNCSQPKYVSGTSAHHRCVTMQTKLQSVSVIRLQGKIL